MIQNKQQAGPVPLVLDLRITHERIGRSSDLSLNGNLRYPNDIDRSLNETADDKILKYRADYNNNPPISTVFMPVIASTSGRLHIPVEESSLLSEWSSSRSSRRKSAAPYPRMKLYVSI